MSTQIVLPTAAAFKEMPLKERAILFGRWLEGQPREVTYDYMDLKGCALGQFAKALYRNEMSFGGAFSIVENSTKNGLGIFPTNPDTPYDCPLGNALAFGSIEKSSFVSSSITFGAASDAYQQGLKTEWFKAICKDATT